MEELTPENTDYLRNLAKGPLAVNGFQILHGSPVDEDEYLVTVSEAAQVTPYLEVPVSFFGHTHLQGGFLAHRRNIRRIQKVPPGEPERMMAIETDSNYLINPGSVGQPRDGDARAAYLLYDSEDRMVLYQRVAYDIESVQQKILKAGLPELLARRLMIGS